MPKHTGFLPREGLYLDPIVKLLTRLLLNPALLLPLILTARYTKRGENLSVLHPVAYSRIKTLFYISVARWFNRWLSDKALNNWVDDKYVWSKEIVLITGGAGGIGEHVVKMFTEKGVTVVVLDLQPLAFRTSSNVHYYQCDITSVDKLATVAAQIRTEVGHPTILINNAGVARGKTILDSSPEDIRLTYDVNTLSHYWTTKEFLPDMVAKNHGMVVTVASYAAWLCVPNMVDYAATKSSSMAFHEGLAAELLTRYGAPRVRTVLVNQAYTKTPLFTGFKGGVRFLFPPLEPETVAEAIVSQVMSGRSGQIILPSAMGPLISALRGLPHWCQIRMRLDARDVMSNWTGRQVIEDVKKYYAEKDRGVDTEESTVLVSEQ